MPFEGIAYHSTSASSVSIVAFERTIGMDCTASHSKASLFTSSSSSAFGGARFPLDFAELVV